MGQILFDVINELEALLPIAKAGSEGCFSLVKSTYLDASSLALKNISVRLCKVRLWKASFKPNVPCFNFDRRLFSILARKRVLNPMTLVLILIADYFQY